MKKIKYLFYASVILLIGACEERSVEPDGFQDVAWLTSHNGNPGFQVDVVGGTAGFADLSQNPKSHRWEVDSGIFFLKGSITNGEINSVRQGNRKALEKYIAERKDTTSSDAVINVFFSYANPVIQVIDGQKRRVSKVRLVNTFTDSVTFRGRENVGSVWSDSLNAWLMETTFLIDVYDSLAGQVEVEANGGRVWDNYLGNEYDSLQTVTIFEGESVLFKDRTVYDRPDNVTIQIYDWPEDDGLPRVDPIRSENRPAYDPDAGRDGLVQVDFPAAGTFVTKYLVRRARATHGEDTPKAEHENQRRSAADSVWVPIKIVVKESEAPFSLSVAKELVEYDGMSSIITLESEVPFKDLVGGEEAHFTVTGDDMTEYTPTSVTLVDNADGQPMLLQLAVSHDFVYTDNVTVEFDGIGAPIVSLNGKRAMEAWGPVTVKVFDPNLLAQADIDWNFTKNGAGWLPTVHQGYGQRTDQLQFGFVTAGDGATVLRAWTEPLNGGSLNAVVTTDFENNAIAVPAGDYNFTMRFRLVQAANISPLEVRIYVADGTGHAQGPGGGQIAGYFFGNDSWKDGNWVDINSTVNLTQKLSGSVRFQMKFAEQPTDQAIVEFDDIRLTPVVVP